LKPCAQQISIQELFDRLPKRFSRAALLKNFPRQASEQIIARLSPPEEAIKEIISMSRE